MATLRALQNALSFNSRSSSSTIFPTTEEREALEPYFLADLQPLQDFKNCLSTGWIEKALDVCLSMHREIHDIFPQIRQNSNLMDETLDDTVKLLDICNAIRDNLRDIKQYHEKLQLVVHTLNGRIGPWQIIRARMALENMNLSAKSTDPMQNKSRLENCSTLLRRKGGKPANPCVDGELVKSIHAAMDFTVFVCDILFAALSIRCKRSIAPPCAAHSAINALQIKVKEEVEKRRSKGTVCVLLDELCAVDSASQGLYDLLKLFLNCQSGQLTEEEDLKLRESVACLRECLSELEDGMDCFENQIDELFKVVVGGRMALLGALTHL